MSTTYLARVALDELDHAQASLTDTLRRAWLRFPEFPDEWVRRWPAEEIWSARR